MELNSSWERGFELGTLSRFRRGDYVCEQWGHVV